MGTLKQTNTQGVYRANAQPAPITGVTSEMRVCTFDLERLKGVQASITEHRSHGEVKRYTVSAILPNGAIVTFRIHRLSNVWSNDAFINSVLAHSDITQRYFIGQQKHEDPAQVLEMVMKVVDSVGGSGV